MIIEQATRAISVMWGSVVWKFLLNATAPRMSGKYLLGKTKPLVMSMYRVDKKSSLPALPGSVT